MHQRHSILTVAIALASTAIVGFGSIPADAVSKYSFKRGAMYTIEYSDPPGPYAAQTRWGRIDSKGRVSRLSGDLGLKQVTDADYSTDDGRVYVIAEAYSDACELWSFEPARPTTTLRKLANVARPGFAPAMCTALTVQHGTGDIAISVSDSVIEGLFVNYYSEVDGSYVTTDMGFYQTPSDPFNALDAEGGRAIGITSFGDYTYFEGMAEDSGTISNGKGVIHSARFDGAGTPWILAWGESGVRLGRPSADANVVKWGPVLKDAKKKRKWLSDTLVFIPR